MCVRNVDVVTRVRRLLILQSTLAGFWMPETQPSALGPAVTWFISCILFNWSCKTAADLAPRATGAVLTAGQFAVCCLLGWVALSVEHGFAPVASVRQMRSIFPAERRFAMAVAQIAVALVCANLAMMMALEHVSVALFQTTKAASPVITVLVTVLLFSQRYAFSTYASLVPLVVGFYLAASSTHGSEISGFGLAGCAASTLAQVFVNLRAKHIYATRYNYCADSTNLTQTVKATQLQFAISIFAAALTLAGGVAMHAVPKLLPPAYLPASLGLRNAGNESSNAAVVDEDEGGQTRLVLVVFANGVLYWAESVCAYSCNSRLRPLPFAIMDSVRRLSIVVSSFVLYGRSPTQTNIGGILLVLCGALAYVFSIRTPAASLEADPREQDVGAKKMS